MLPYGWILAWGRGGRPVRIAVAPRGEPFALSTMVTSVWHFRSGHVDDTTLVALPLSAVTCDDRWVTSPSRTWYRRMSGRHTNEEHRAATPLELLFDLCFVVAVAQAAAALHHDLSAHRFGHATLSYVAVFFAIWWAWLVCQWLRAAHGDPARRRTALRFAAGVTLVQLGWVARLALPPSWAWAAFIALGIAELAVPVLAERASKTPYHRHHVAERYGLFTLIVLGESVLAATVAVQTALDAGQASVRLLVLAGSGLLIVFAMWWLYFDRSAGNLLTTARMAFLWGYGHYLVFAGAAAVGAGLATAAEGSLSPRGAAFAVTVPVAVYLTAVWLLQVYPQDCGPVTTAAFPIAAALVVLASFTPAPLPIAALVMVTLVGATTPLARRP
jgi:low temperature requirement protein LtrA